MTRLQWLLALLGIAAVAVGLLPGLGGAVPPGDPFWFVLLAALLFLASAIRGQDIRLVWALALVSSLGALVAIAALGEATPKGAGYWSLIIGSWLAAWLLVERLSVLPDKAGWIGTARRLAIPLIFGAWLLILWEVVVRAAGVPAVLLPPPGMIWERLAGSVPTLWADFRQTFLKAVIAGYVLGCLSGFAVAVLVDRVGFLKRGLMPIGNLMSALPIV
ncbi:MAG TPA: ABC transporter permease, partial [Afifellaceae bacterium]|nr:ABC transporter permease [Afifellaceae bacterium]